MEAGAISSWCCQSNPVGSEKVVGQGVLCVPMEAHSQARERACTSAPIAINFIWGHMEKRKSREYRHGTPEDPA